MSKKMETTLFNLKMTSRQLVRQSKKSEKNEKSARKKVEAAIKKGNMEGAKIYASNAIREKNQALNYLRLSSRIDAVSARVETAVRMNQLTKGMKGVVKGMDSVLGSMDVGKISSVMEKFEKQFEDLDVRTGYMESAMDASTSMTTPEDEVHGLISQVADAAGLDVGADFEGLSAPSGAGVAAAAPVSAPRAAVPMGAAAPAPAPGPGGDDSSGGGGGGGGGGGAPVDPADALAARLAALRK